MNVTNGLSEIPVKNEYIIMLHIKQRYKLFRMYFNCSNYSEERNPEMDALFLLSLSEVKYSSIRLGSVEPDELHPYSESTLQLHQIGGLDIPIQQALQHLYSIFSKANLLLRNELKTSGTLSARCMQRTHCVTVL
jgi:hypothetical protein